MKESIIVVGAGARGLYFIQMLAEDLGRTVHAVVENNPHMDEIMRYRLKQFGIPQTPVVRTVDQALARLPAGAPRVLFIMTPEWTHLPLFRQAVKADGHIFLEKPVATTRRDVLEVRRLARRSRRVIQLGFVRQFLANVAHRRRPIPGVAEGVRASLLAFAADRSVATGRAVPLDS